jgi:hypothetical protein
MASIAHVTPCLSSSKCETIGYGRDMVSDTLPLSKSNQYCRQAFQPSVFQPEGHLSLFSFHAHTVTVSLAFAHATSHPMNSMATFQSRALSPVWTLKHRPWPLSTAVAPKLLVDEAIEEERTPYYDPARFYPVRLGNVLNDRYQLTTKVGYGSSSTVWLARDLNQFVLHVLPTHLE